MSRFGSEEIYAQRSTRTIANDRKNSYNSNVENSRRVRRPRRDLSIYEGSAVRVMDPEMIPGNVESTNEAQERRRIERHLPMNLPSAIFLGFAIAAVVYLCFGYLKLNNEMLTRTKTVAAQEKQLEAQREENINFEAAITKGTDYAYVYDMATNVLGMKMVSGDQVRTFETSNGEYSYQYDEIPQAEK
ncbi:MAG: hypothetical protein J5825_06195 [Lachnospiraceae bacterium]|nr:hypothetical protein [Lachnospiraceae bacterium]